MSPARRSARGDQRPRVRRAAGVPLLAIAWLIFRGVAALAPAAVGGVSVLGSFVILRLVNEQLSLSNFAPTP